MPRKTNIAIDKATVAGMSAPIVWAFMTSCLRLTTAGFGSELAAALIYTLAAVILLATRRPEPLSSYPKRYLVISGLIFVTYETCFSLSIACATSSEQAIEVSLVNYLWPTLTVLFSAAAGGGRKALACAVPGAVVATVGIFVAVGGNSGMSVAGFVEHVGQNPLSYGLALFGAFIWGIYSVVTPKLAGGKDAISLFFPAISIVLWIVFFATGEGFPTQLPGVLSWIGFIGGAISIGSGYALWNHGILHGDLRKMAAFSYFAPLFSIAVTAAVLQVSLAAIFWAGTVAVVLGSLLNWRLSR